MFIVESPETAKHYFYLEHSCCDIPLLIRKCLLKDFIDDLGKIEAK